MTAPMAFFERTPVGFEPLAYSASAWSPDMVNGPAVCGLLARTLELEFGAPEFTPVRLTVDLFRPVQRRTSEVRTVEVRSGNRIRVADAELVQDGEVKARATAVFLRRSQQPPGELWTRAELPAPPPEELSDPPGRPLWGSDDHPDGWTGDLSEHQNASRKRCWQTPLPTVLGEPLTPFAAVATIAEAASLMTNWSTAGVGFINADLTIALTRPVRGTAIGVEGDSHFSEHGISVGSATLFDREGAFGTAMVTALANAERTVDFVEEDFAELRRG
ncbi:acyl-CoA thioesterase domain-containing protein [Nocardia bovistercoris]|uniref:Thioesterase family protein n=1 Tax=Nocardia bovistercoris TaxID=2785916 RepID=A0A931IGV3_9NOCA|nr:acyl-CoA thioesterase domain-containing protein [Nocardia bovistercoris]MBH0781512.1 thioesterase family protein [Nocardia bovistercoris]